MLYAHIRFKNGNHVQVIKAKVKSDANILEKLWLLRDHWESLFETKITIDLKDEVELNNDINRDKSDGT